MQWASSIATREICALCTTFMNSYEFSLSGAIYKNFIASFSLKLVDLSSSNISLWSVPEIVEFINSARIQSSFNLSIWSFISDISGEMTIVNHSRATPGN